MKTNKKKMLILVLLLALLIGVGSTVAWLTSVDTIVNEFTVGEFNSPTTDPENPSTTITIDGNLYEKGWNPNETHKLLPGVSFAKQPYVGVGEGSEEAVVYIYVDNDFSNKVYFTVNSGWTPVSGHTTAGSLANSYTSGLFKYNSNLDSSSADDWTTPLFDEVIVADDATTEDLTPSGSTYNITVKSFIHQAKDASGTAISSATIESAAIAALEN